MSADWFDSLVNELARLPGIGRRTAARLAFALVDDRELARSLSEVLRQTFERIHECPECRNLTDAERCSICTDLSRNASVCVVENVADLRSIDDAGLFRGRSTPPGGSTARFTKIAPFVLKATATWFPIPWSGRILSCASKRDP